MAGVDVANMAVALFRETRYRAGKRLSPLDILFFTCVAEGHLSRLLRERFVNGELLRKPSNRTNVFVFSRKIKVRLSDREIRCDYCCYRESRRREMLSRNGINI